jgi:GxxExxY protein
MNTDENGLKKGVITGRIIGVFYDVYNEMAAGFLEAVYRRALYVALKESGLNVDREMPLIVRFRGNVVGSFRADLVVNESVLVEAKALPRICAAHEAQVLNYLRATILEVGLLLNFGPRPQIRRFLFDNIHKRSPQSHCSHQTIRPNPCSSVAANSL